MPATNVDGAKSDNAGTTMPVISPVTGRIGATVDRIDPRVEQSPEVRQMLDIALHDHGVLFVRYEGAIDDDDHNRFAGTFGNVNRYAYNRRIEGDRSISVITEEGTVFGTDRWHTDSTALECPPGAAVLRAIVLPTTGGDTMWASMYAAYEALSSHYQRLLDGLDALHTSEALCRVRPAARQTEGLGEPQSAVHPVVIRDPVTNRPALFVNSNWTERILGLTDNESESLLRMLFEHVNTPDLHVRFRWDTRTLVVWDERVTQHRAISDYVGRRVLRRATVDGIRPEAWRA